MAWTPKSTRILIDPLWIGLIEAAVHELIHVDLDPIMSQLGSLDEICVTALGKAVENHIYTNPKRSRWWISALTTRLYHKNTPLSTQITEAR